MASHEAPYSVRETRLGECAYTTPLTGGVTSSRPPPLSTWAHLNPALQITDFFLTYPTSPIDSPPAAHPASCSGGERACGSGLVPLGREGLGKRHRWGEVAVCFAPLHVFAVLPLISPTPSSRQTLATAKRTYFRKLSSFRSVFMYIFRETFLEVTYLILQAVFPFCP